MVIKLKNQWETEQPFNLLSWGHWFTFANLLLALVFSAFYVVDYTAPSTFSGWLYFFSTWLGHFAFLSLSCFIVTIFPVIILFPYKRHIRGVSAIMASVMQFLLFLDVLAYRGLGYHLSSSSLNQLREVEDVYVAMMGDSYFLMLIAVFAFILIYQFIASNYTWKKIHLLQEYTYRYVVAGFLIGSFFFSHLMHIWADATLNTDVAKQGSMFPGHYPLTAKTLLARYDLINLEEHKLTRSNRALVNSPTYDITPTVPVSCEVNNKPKLKVTLVPKESVAAIQKWLSNNNIKYTNSNQLSIPSNLNTLLFNFETGLPGLYQSSTMPLGVNQILKKELISVELLNSEFDSTTTYSELSAKRVFVFYDANNIDTFYRTRALLIGFDDVADMAFSPQNIIASYMTDALDCEMYVKENLVDAPLEEIDFSNITTHFSDGHFYFVHKDNALLFKNGQLVKNTTYSSNKEVKGSVDVFLLQEAANKLTSRRIRVESPK